MANESYSEGAAQAENDTGSLTHMMPNSFAQELTDFRRLEGSGLKPVIPNSFAQELTKIRELAGLTQQQLARRSGAAPSSVNRWEKGGSIPKKDNVERLDAALEAGGELLVAWRRAHGGPELPEWAHDLNALEQGARKLAIAAPTLVPGSLQCATYARMVFLAGHPLLDESELDHLTRRRCERLVELPDLTVTAVFPISALTGFSESIAKEQAAHLLAWADTGRVVLHLVPQDCTMVVPISPVMLFHMRSGELIATCDYADGNVVVAYEAQEAVTTQFNAALAASLPFHLSLAALKELI